MSANGKYCRKQPLVIIPGNYLCTRCDAAGVRSPKMSRRPRTAVRRAIALISIWRTTLGSA